MYIPTIFYTCKKIGAVKKQIEAGGEAQVVELLFCKLKTLSSNHSPTKKKKLQFSLQTQLSRSLVTHTYNPSYSRGRNQEDQGSKSS
jgi:hypothetical protein